MLDLRPAQLADARRLFDWRNDVQTRQMSRSPEAIGWDDHLHWLNEQLARSEPSLFIAEDDGHPVGTVRIHDEEISYTVAPDARGRGLATAMLRLAYQRFGPKLAEIRPGNAASIKAARNAGHIVRIIEDKMPDYNAIIDQIEAVRTKNNHNWMDLLRLAFKHAPDEAATILSSILQQDERVSELAKQLAARQ